MSVHSNGLRQQDGDGWEAFDPSLLEDVNPDAILSGGKRLVVTVGEREVVKGYIADEYKYAQSTEAKKRRDTLRDASEVYGDQMHRIRGDGNCGTTAFATGLLYNILNNQPEKSSRDIEYIISLMTNLEITTDQLSSDISEVLGLLEGYKTNLNDQFLQDGLLKNDSFMLAFSRVIRAIGHQNIKNVMRIEIAESEMNSEEYAEMIIPKAPKEEISTEGFKALSLLFNLNTHVIDITGQSGGELIRQYPTTQNLVADIVIVRVPNHFLNIVSDKQRQSAHGLRQTQAERQVGLEATQTFTLHQRSVRPVQHNYCNTIAKIAIPVIGLIGLWYLKSCV